MISEDIVGIREAGGVKPGVSGLFPAPGGGTSHTPGQTIGALQEAAFGPLWKYVGAVENALADVSHRYDGLMQQFFKPEHYMAASRRGEATSVEWTDQHRIAQFRRIVVSGATTPIYDTQREEREAFVKRIVDEAIATEDPRMVKSALIYINHMIFPWTGDYVELLEAELQNLEQKQQGLQQLGVDQLLSGGQGAPGLSAQQAQPPEQAIGNELPAVLQELADDMGVTPEQIEVAASR